MQILFMELGNNALFLVFIAQSFVPSIASNGVWHLFDYHLEELLKILHLENDLAWFDSQKLP